MDCRSCGAKMKEGEKFCGVCGRPVEEINNQVNNAQSVNNNFNQVNNNQTMNNNYNQVNNNQTMNNNYNQDNYGYNQANNGMYNNYNQQNNMNQNPVSKEESSCTTFGIIGLIASFFINILSLPFSIIAVVKGAKLKKSTNKTQPGFIMGIIGIVISIIIFLFFFFVIVIAVREVNSAIDTAKENSSSYNDKYYDDLEDSIKVGNADVGYIYIPDDWKEFKDVSVDDKNMIQYSDIMGDEVVTMTVFEKPSYTLEQYQQSLKTLLEDNNSDSYSYITDYTDYLDNYKITARKIGGKYQNKYLYTWTFDDLNGNIHYIALESSESDSDVFDLIETYKFDGNVDKSTY